MRGCHGLSHARLPRPIPAPYSSFTFSLFFVLSLFFVHALTFECCWGPPATAASPGHVRGALSQDGAFPQNDLSPAHCGRASHLHGPPAQRPRRPQSPGPPLRRHRQPGVGAVIRGAGLAGVRVSGRRRGRRGRFQRAAQRTSTVRHRPGPRSARQPGCQRQGDRPARVAPATDLAPARADPLVRPTRRYGRVLADPPHCGSSSSLFFALLPRSSSLFFLVLPRSSSSLFFFALLPRSSSSLFFALLLRSSSSLFFALLLRSSSSLFFFALLPRSSSLFFATDHGPAGALPGNALGFPLDVAQSVFYTAALLRRYHALLTAQEQALLLTRMEQLMATLVPTLGPGSGRLMDGTLDGLPDVVAMEYCRSVHVFRFWPLGRGCGPNPNPAVFPYPPVSRTRPPLSMVSCPRPPRRALRGAADVSILGEFCWSASAPRRTCSQSQGRWIHRARSSPTLPWTPTPSATRSFTIRSRAPRTLPLPQYASDACCCFAPANRRPHQSVVAFEKIPTRLCWCRTSTSTWW